MENYISKIFLQLTSTTCPYGYEDVFFKIFMKPYLPKNVKMDNSGNYYLKIGQSKTIFTSHIDTVSYKFENVDQLIDDDNNVFTTGKTNLGADDKAGMTIMFNMIKNNVPGLYYFFIGEESGTIGSSMAAMSNTWINYNKIISFDRKGTDSIITHQSFQRSCSDVFARSLASELNKNNELNYKLDSSGVYTDSAEFMDLIPECTNISVGYKDEHTVNETQNLNHLNKLSKAVLQVDWENLKIDRDPTIIEYEDIYNNKSNVEIDTYVDHSHENYENDNYIYPFDVRTKKDWKKGREYYDNGDGELRDYNSRIAEINNNNEIEDGDKYSWIIKKFTNEEFTPNEIEIIRDCYLNMNDDYDIFFYEFLKENIMV